MHFLAELTELKVANNSFTGFIPVEIMKCRSLSVVNFEGNNFAGEVPTFFGNVKGHKVLSLGGNRFIGSVPASFGNLSLLETLSLISPRWSCSKLANETPHHIRNCPRISLHTPIHNGPW
jgi:hypothetical protein